MNKTLEISAMQYDFHTLLKVSDICGLTGEIGFHDTDSCVFTYFTHYSAPAGEMQTNK